MDDERMGVYYIKESKTLLLGMPKDQIASIKNPFTVAYFPFEEIVKTARLKLTDIEELAITTCDNFAKIAESHDTEARLWAEFMEWKRTGGVSKRGEVVSIKKDVKNEKDRANKVE